MITTFTPILAILDSDVGAWIAVAVTVGGLVVIVLRVVEFFKASPPNHRQFADRAETEKRFDTVDRKIESVRDEGRAQFAVLLNAGEERAAKIHSRINILSERVSELIGEIRKH